jgi:hypothetical protein
VGLGKVFPNFFLAISCAKLIIFTFCWDTKNYLSSKLPKKSSKSFASLKFL